jgi:hypothetical protein
MKLSRPKMDSRMKNIEQERKFGEEYLSYSGKEEQNPEKRIDMINQINFGVIKLICF